ncbi:MAG: hypothetical protein P9L94_05805 [Candidatus Hinthialibacter antarcticus]|nr:hypothetical protein [Candidatus Hinthialibacter antarcticus]
MLNLPEKFKFQPDTLAKTAKRLNQSSNEEPISQLAALAVPDILKKGEARLIVAMTMRRIADNFSPSMEPIAPQDAINQAAKTGDRRALESVLSEWETSETERARIQRQL